MSESVHPHVVRRLMDNQRKHRSAIPVGEATAAEAVNRIDPHRVLSLAIEIGEERAAEVLRGELSAKQWEEDHRHDQPKRRR